MFSTTQNSKNAKKQIKILWNFEKIRLKSLKIAKKLFFDSKNYRLTSAHLQKFFFLILWILLYPVKKKLDRPNEPKRVKKPKCLKWLRDKNSKSSERHENFFPGVFFVVDFESELRIDKNFSIQPVSAISAIFRTFARTYPISLKLYQNREDVILIKNHEKKLAIFMAI